MTNKVPYESAHLVLQPCIESSKGGYATLGCGILHYCFYLTYNISAMRHKQKGQRKQNKPYV